MPHFPGWFVAICVLLPVSNVIYKTWKNNKKKQLSKSLTHSHRADEL